MKEEGQASGEEERRSREREGGEGGGKRCVDDHCCSLCSLPNPDFVHVLWGYSKVSGVRQDLHRSSLIPSQNWDWLRG